MRQRPFGSCDLDSKASSTFSKVAGSRGGAPAAEAHFWSGLQFEEQQEGAFFKKPPLYQDYEMDQTENGLCPLKRQVSGSLKRQVSMVALCKHTKVSTAHSELHPIAAFNLKGHIIPGGGGGMEPMGAAGVPCVCVMMRDLGSFGHNHSRNRQPRRLVVPVPGAKAADHRCNKNPDHQKKHNRDQEFRIPNTKPNPISSPPSMSSPWVRAS